MTTKQKWGLGFGVWVVLVGLASIYNHQTPEEERLSSFETKPKEDGWLLKGWDGRVLTALHGGYEYTARCKEHIDIGPDPQGDVSSDPKCSMVVGYIGHTIQQWDPRSTMARDENGWIEAMFHRLDQLMLKRWRGQDGDWNQNEYFTVISVHPIPEEVQK